MYKMVVTQQFCDFCIDTSSGDSSVWKGMSCGLLPEADRGQGKN
jgi:hypothetical protein